MVCSPICRAGIVLNTELFTVVISNRLVKSPCAVVADNYGYTANVQRMMSTYTSFGLHEQPN